MNAPTLNGHREAGWTAEAATANARATGGEPGGFDPLRVSDLIDAHPDLRPAVVEGLLRQGEVANFVAAPKVGKSWLVHSLAAAVASGRPWLGRDTTAGGVLLIDGELHSETLAHRLRRTIAAAGLDQNALAANLTVWPVRGRRHTFDTIARATRHVPAGTYRLVVVDAMYRFMPTDGEENSNETMTRVYNEVDAIADRLGAAVVLVHHTTKGYQGEKSVTDVGAGGGAQSRAADTHLILRHHEEEGAVVVEAVVRSWKPAEPFVIRWKDPGWTLAPDLDPAALRRPARRTRAAAAESDAPKPDLREWTPEAFAAEVVGTVPSIREDVLARAKDHHGLSKAQAEGLLKRAERGSHVRRVTAGPCSPHLFTASPDPQAALPGGGRPRPGHAPGASRSGGCGGERAPPPPPSQDVVGASNPQVETLLAQVSR